MDMVTMNLQVDEAVFARIESIAKRFGRGVEETAADLLTGSIDEDYLAAVEEGLQDIAAGRVVGHVELASYVQARLRGEHLEKPTWK